MTRQSDAIGDAIEKLLARVAKELTLEVAKELRRAPHEGGTPVDTGHARANWIPSVGVPHTGEVQGSAAYTAGSQQVMRFTLDAGALYVSNSVPYIRKLNEGHSKQAPRLFIEMAIDRALSTVNRRYAGRMSIDRASLLGQTAGGQELLGAELAENLAGAYSPFGGDDD